MPPTARMESSKTEPPRPAGGRLDEALRIALRRDRGATLAVLAIIGAIAWLYLIHLAGDTATADGVTAMTMPAVWTPAYAALVAVMWIVMMIAMMLPAAAPMILLYGAVIRRTPVGVESAIRTALFAGGYVAVWSGFALLATAVQSALEDALALAPMQALPNPAMAGAVLIAAGLYQWTPLKQSCLRHCRSPFAFLIHHWRDGKGGAFRMGVAHGAYCLGCCWALMALLFVGGVMNVLWMAALAMLVLIEKTAPYGNWMARAVGAGLVAWGAAAAIAI